MKKTHFLCLAACLLLAAACSNKKDIPSPDGVDALKLKDYEPVSVFNVEENHPAFAKYSAIDMHSHAYRQDEAGIRAWVKTLEENHIEKVIVLTKAYGEEFDQLYDLLPEYPTNSKSGAGSI